MKPSIQYTVFPNVTIHMYVIEKLRTQLLEKYLILILNNINKTIQSNCSTHS